MTRQNLAPLPSYRRGPPEGHGRLPNGHDGPATPEERARLEALKDQTLAHLKGQGCTGSWLAEKTGVGMRHVSAYLRELGAHSFSGRWKFPVVGGRRVGWGHHG